MYPEATGVQTSFLAADLGSVEWPIIQSNLPKMAVLMGEFGTYEGTFPDVVLAGACFHVVVLMPGNLCNLLKIYRFSREEYGSASEFSIGCNSFYRTLFEFQFIFRSEAAATASADGCTGHGTATSAQVWT